MSLRQCAEWLQYECRFCAVNVPQPLFGHAVHLSLQNCVNKLAGLVNEKTTMPYKQFLFPRMIWRKEWPSKILVHCWKKHFRHFPVNFSSSKFFLFCFLLFLGYCWIQHCLYNFIPFFSFMLYSLFDKSLKSLYVWKFSLSWCGMSWQLLLIIDICSFSWVKFTYFDNWHMLHLGCHYLTETSSYICSNWGFNKWLCFFLGQDVLFI